MASEEFRQLQSAPQAEQHPSAHPLDLGAGTNLRSWNRETMREGHSLAEQKELAVTPLPPPATTQQWSGHHPEPGRQ